MISQICPRCNASVTEGQKFCQNCGHRLAGTSTIAKRLMMLRAESGETQAELAESVGMSVPAINRHENGNRNPHASTIIKFCQHYNVSADWLLGLRNDR